MTDDLWIPERARGFTEVEPGVHVKLTEGEVPSPGPDDAVFLHGEDFGTVFFEPGEDKHGRASIPFVRVDFEPLRRLAMAGTFSGYQYGVCEGLATADGTVVPFPDGLKLYLHGDFVVYIGGLDEAPEGWLDTVMGGAGFMVIFPPEPNGEEPWIATGPLHKFAGGSVVLPPPARRGDRVGRNEPCPCGSGFKFKRCCGAAA